MTTPTPAPAEPRETPADGAAETSRRPRRLLVVLGVGLVAVVAAVVAVTVLDGPDAPLDPVAALTKAADTTGEVDTLRVHGAYVDGDGIRLLDVEVDGRDYSLRSRRQPAPTDGSGAEERTIVIGDQRWTDGDPEPVTVPDEERAVPFPEASRAVVQAALQGAQVTDEGTEVLRSGAATHYRIDLGPDGVAALGALAPGQVAVFELEDPEDVTTLEVWVADDLIRRIAHTVEAEGVTGSVTVDAFDFDADIAVEPPA